MTFTKAAIEYRIAFDSVKNEFLAIDAHNENHVASGVTIEQAITNLKNAHT